MIKIITGSENKYRDMSSALEPIPTEKVTMELEEVQSLDPKIVIEHKLKSAHLRYGQDEFLLDDRSLSIDGLNGLPGTFVKWFLETVGAEGIYKMAKTGSSMRAQARSYLGYCSLDGEYYFFEGVVEGQIVEPRGELDYGWGPLFLPDGSNKTFGEMNKNEKAQWSHYGVALAKFKEFYIK